VLCVLVQFKTVPSRDDDHVELDHLYRGKSVYKFNAQTNKIALLGILCSDAFDFTAHVDQHHHNVLLLHLQLNKSPGHQDYAAYRQRLFQVATSSRIEIVCLNWAANVMVSGDPTPFNAIAGSAWYVAPGGLDLTDNNVDQLHRDGIYYSVVSKRWHGLYLHYGPHALVVRKHRLFADGPQVLVQRLPPDVVERTRWHDGTSSWQLEPADDGFVTFVANYAPLHGSLPTLCGSSSLAVERALELVVGPSGTPEHWFAVRVLEALRIGDEDSIQLVTVSQETDAARRGVIFRRERIRRAQTAIRLPAEAVPWLPSVTDLAGGFVFRWSIDAPHHNVEPASGGRGPATLVYLGENPESTTVEKMYSKLRKALERHAVNAAMNQTPLPDLNAVARRAAERLCVVFRTDGRLKVFRPAGYASFVGSADTPAADITRGEL
jgi:hypothetical protein